VIIATWNVNGVRARQAELLAWLAAEQPDVVCLQEIKASIDQLPFELRDVEGYWSFWHGQKGYSGVALLVSKRTAVAEPSVQHPAFDFEQRIATVDLLSGVAPITVASVYVPNGGKDFEAKLRFLEALDAWADEAARDGRTLVVCGDLNVEREALERLISRNLVDVGRALDPENDTLFTWWAPWRNLRQRNIGWRIDYVLASTPLSARAVDARVLREVGTSDHGPVVVRFES
jgi:exodeoxyribonuclease III